MSARHRGSVSREQLAVAELKSVSAEGNLGRPAPDHRDAAYWDRVRRLVDSAPPLSDATRARLRAILHQPGNEERAA